MSHGSFAKKIFWPLLQRPVLRRATCFHATAMAEYHDIRRLGFRQPVAIIPHGIDAQPLPARSAACPRTVLFLGRIHAKKGLDILLQAWCVVEKQFPDWRLVIAGGDDGYHGGRYLDQIRAEAKRLALKCVEFPGPIYGEEKLKMYRNADIYVLPTYSENFAITVAEALSMGTPAIVSKGAPWADLNENGAGWWIDIGVDPLIGCLKTAMECSREVLAAKGYRGRTWVQSNFSWESIATRMSLTYQWLIDRSLPAPEWVKMD
jgi:glycosyltransferase involved in cell wall biosynthesis